MKKNIQTMISALLMSAMIFTGCSSGGTNNSKEPQNESSVNENESSAQEESEPAPSSSETAEEEIPLLKSTGQGDSSRYEVSRWNLKSGEVTGLNIVLQPADSSLYQVFWDGDSFLASDPAMQSADGKIKTEAVAYGSSCYQDNILRYTDAFTDYFEADRTKLTLTTPDGEKEFDISGLSTEDGLYGAEDLFFTSFMVDGGKMYVIFCPEMMLVDNLQLYLAEIDLESGAIQKVSAFDPPQDCTPADPPFADNVFAAQGAGMFVFGPHSVIKLDPVTMERSVAFSTESFEEPPETRVVKMTFFNEALEDAPATQYIYIKKLGYYNGYLLVHWKDEENGNHISAVMDREVIATLDAGKDSYRLPNIVR